VPKVLFSEQTGVAFITLNRPENRNAIDMGLANQLIDLLNSISDMNSVKVAVLTGQGTSFCAGADLKQRRNMSFDQQAEHTEAILKCTNLMELLPVPVIAAINGPAIAGGLELALACDFRIASNKALFSLPEVSLGAFPGAGAPIRLPGLIGMGWAKFLVLTGNKINMDDAFRLGLVQLVTEPEELMREVTDLANRISSYNTAGVRAVKVLMNSVPEMSHEVAASLSCALRHPLNKSPEWLDGINKKLAGKSM